MPFCKTDMHLIDLMPCNHQEADTRLFLHTRHAVASYHKLLMIKATDTDVLVIAIHVFVRIELEQMCLAFGQGENLRRIPVHDLAAKLSREKSFGLPIFHAFIGCDVVSSFRGNGKKQLGRSETFSQRYHLFLPNLADIKYHLVRKT